jgi:hypothetical protein
MNTERLLEQRWCLMNSFGDGAFRDGLKQQRIDPIDRLLDEAGVTAHREEPAECR